MQKKLAEIADRQNIDQVTAWRLQSCLDSRFASCPIRYFRTRKARFVAADSSPLCIKISGFAEPFQAEQLVCCNITNPEDLEVHIFSCEMLSQSATDPGILYLKNGTSTITGPKRSDLSRELDQEARVLEALPRRDPDVVKIDQRVFRQTGTVCVQSPVCLVILERAER